MAHTPKPIRHKLKAVAMLNRYGKKLGYTMFPPVWINGVPHVAFAKPGEWEWETTRFTRTALTAINEHRQKEGE